MALVATYRSLDKRHVHQRHVPVIAVYVHRQGLADRRNPFRLQPSVGNQLRRPDPPGFPPPSGEKHCWFPVEIGNDGNCELQPQATARLVPSPPRVTRQVTPSRCHLRRGPDSVSLGVVGGHFQHGQAEVQVRVIAGPFAKVGTVGHSDDLFNSYSLQSDQYSLRTMLTFSQSGMTLPCATSRRMSLLAAGLAMIPTFGQVPLSLSGGKCLGNSPPASPLL